MRRVIKYKSIEQAMAKGREGAIGAHSGSLAGVRGAVMTVAEMDAYGAQRARELADRHFDPLFAAYWRAYAEQLESYTA